MGMLMNKIMGNKWGYIIYLALRDNKLLYYDKSFVLSYDIKEKRYKIWYTSDADLLDYFEGYETACEAKFAWNVLLNRGRNK